MQLFKNLEQSILKNKDLSSFLIDDIYYTYQEFSNSISKIRKAITLKCEENEKNIGLVTNDDLETYATIIALWFEGKSYVPLNPEAPMDRNTNIIHQADIITIIDSSKTPLFNDYSLILSKNLQDTSLNLTPKIATGKELAYILFTSGTTGKPKGVPITRDNLSCFIDSFWTINFDINEEDRFLQMFDLTFDLSVWSYLVPLLKGACIYTIPKNKIKYGYIYQLMDEYKLTVALMVPSILQYLRQHFDEIDSPELKYSLFCGEALPVDVTKEWSVCVPNAKIVNVYGPTENTIFCTQYEFKRAYVNKSINGVLSIGKTMNGVETIIIDNDQKILSPGNVGQLCLGGNQLTPNYWKNEKQNKETFFYIDSDLERRFYKTGDLCKQDKEGDLLYLGRVDQQIQIQGFRVELGEIEYYANLFLDKINVIVVSFPDPIGNTEIGMIIKNEIFDTDQLIKYLKTKLLSYMIPKQVKFVNNIPLNINGKIDRNKLADLFKRNSNE